MLHDLWDGDAFAGVGRQHALQEVPAVLAHALGLLVVGCHDAGEQLLQPHQVVAPVVAPLRKWQHRCSSRLRKLTTMTWCSVSTHEEGMGIACKCFLICLMKHVSTSAPSPHQNRGNSGGRA